MKHLDCPFCGIPLEIQPVESVNQYYLMEPLETAQGAVSINGVLQAADVVIQRYHSPERCRERQGR